MTKPILVGAVIYEPKVATIWEIIKQFFADERCPIDYVFYSNYELQVEALVAGQIHIAWNSPLAWVDALRQAPGKCRAIAMRDTDRDRISHVVVRKNAGISGLDGLRGKTVATGAIDSPQATLIPLQLLRRAGLVAGKDFQQRRFDVLVGKHGDHVGGEKNALECVKSGEADACCVLDLNWDAWQKDGSAGPGLVSIATTPGFDHCNFTVTNAFSADDEKRWTDALFRMRYDVPEHREMMDLEGLKAWLPGRTSGYAILEEATRDQKFFER
jgi:phosphonate transport system substrate-binding protein